MIDPIFTIQEWLAAPLTPTAHNKPLRYAMWWISRYLNPPQERVRYLDFEGGHRLYVTYQGQRYRVMAVHRLGGITLRSFLSDGTAVDQSRQIYREDDFTDWSNTWEGPLDDSKFVPYVKATKNTALD